MFLFFPSLVVSENVFPFPCQVLGETIHITIEYLTNKEKVVMADSNKIILISPIAFFRRFCYFSLSLGLSLDSA